MLKWAKWYYQKISGRNNSSSLQEPLLDETHRVEATRSDKPKDEKKNKRIMVATATTLSLPKDTHDIIRQYLGVGGVNFARTDKEHYQDIERCF